MEREIVVVVKVVEGLVYFAFRGGLRGKRDGLGEIEMALFNEVIMVAILVL